jgi:uncharacterized protein (DUF2235 family)
MQKYREGDKICLFGFSRGAYTVRCLAGMLHKVGLLPASNASQVDFAYDFYKDTSENGKKLAKGFKKTFCTHVEVYFVGVWDCVASVGFIPRRLPFSKSPTNTIRHFRHAMALDEHRAKFKVCHWSQQSPLTKGRMKRRETLDLTPSGRFRRWLGVKRTPALADDDDKTAQKRKIPREINTILRRVSPLRKQRIAASSTLKPMCLRFGLGAFTHMLEAAQWRTNLATCSLDFP